MTDRQRINIDVSPFLNGWLKSTADRMGVTKTELCRQIILNGLIYGLNTEDIVKGVKEHQELGNQARSQSQILRHRAQQQ
jgi:hypothetical protein